MVPGSTLMYGSNFCSRTLSPRRSNNMPMEAHVSPLPSELTTPPVTKMNLVMRSGSPQRSGRTWWAIWAAGSETSPRHYTGNDDPGHLQPGSPLRRAGPGSVLGHKTLIIRWRIDAAPGMSDDPDANRPAMPKRPELLQLLQLLQRVRGE